MDQIEPPAAMLAAAALIGMWALVGTGAGMASSKRKRSHHVSGRGRDVRP